MKNPIAIGAACLVLSCMPMAAAEAMPLTPMTSVMTSTIAGTGADATVVRYGGRGNHYGWGRGRGRGHNYGWSRGRHRGWR